MSYKTDSEAYAREVCDQHGFELQATGGGCTAIVKRLQSQTMPHGEGGWAVLTCDAVAPQYPDDDEETEYNLLQVYKYHESGWGGAGDCDDVVMVIYGKPAHQLIKIMAWME